LEEGGDKKKREEEPQKQAVIKEKAVPNKTIKKKSLGHSGERMRREKSNISEAFAMFDKVELKR